MLEKNAHCFCYWTIKNTTQEGHLFNPQPFCISLKVSPWAAPERMDKNLQTWIFPVHRPHCCHLSLSVDCLFLSDEDDDDDNVVCYFHCFVPYFGVAMLSVTQHILLYTQNTKNNSQHFCPLLACSIWLCSVQNWLKLGNRYRAWLKMWTHE